MTLSLKKRAFFSIIVLTAIICLFSYVANAQSSVENIRFGINADSTRLVIETQHKTAFRSFILSNPYRIVIDLPKLDQVNKQITSARPQNLKDFRYGALNDRVTRLVFEHTSPTIIKNAFFLPPLNGGNHRLVLDTASATIETFAQNKTKIFGVQALEAIEASTATPNVITQATTQATTPATVTTNSQTTFFTPPNPKAKPILEQAQGFIRQAEAAPLPDYTPRQIKEHKGGKKIIVLDAGHGGKDPGAISVTKMQEKHITLAIAKQLKKDLEATGRYKVLLTRTGDYYIRLRQRVVKARNANADMFISLHADSMHSNKVRGASVYTLSETSSDKEAARLAERENKSDIIAGVPLEEEIDEIADILIDLSMRDTMNQSKKFGNMIVDSFQSKGIKVLGNTHRFAGFAVLKAPDVPSVLIETGYLSNKQDANLLKKPAHQRKISGAIVNAIDRFFAQ